MAVETPICDFGWRPTEFRLEATDGKNYSLDDVKGPKGTLIMFLCNHCPYVQAVVDRLVADVKALQSMGIGAAAIMANDTVAYPEDSFPNMGRFAQKHGFTFPYLWDREQTVARSWGAVCTPDFFGFGAATGLQYRGRLDSARLEQPAPGARRELVEAMRMIAETGRGPERQSPSMGCSIKWKPD